MASPAVQAEDDIDEQVDEQIDDVDEPSTENEAENQEEEQASAETVDEDRASTDDEDLNPEDEQDVDDDDADSDVDTADSGEGTEGMTTEEEPEPSDDIDDVQDGNGEQTAPTDGLVDVPEITDEVDITEPAEEVLEAEDIGTEEKVDELEEIDFATPVVSPSDTDHVFDASKPYGKNSTLASAMQTGLQVENYAITGTLHPLSDQDHWMAEYWGSGYFVGLHIDWTNITSEALTNLEMIKFGLEPSMGSGAVTLTGDAALRPQNDDDKAGDINFKLTDPSKQKFVVYTKVGDRTKKEEYDLSGLVLEKSQDLTGPTITEETEDMFGVSAATYQRAGTVKTEEKSRKNYLQGELIYQGESANNALTTKWGVGYFVGLHFGDASYWESNEDVSVRVGLYESHGTLYQYDGKTVGGYGGKHTDLTAEELETWLNTRNNFVEIMDDPDKNGVFKISDKDSQVFQVITTKKDDEGKYDVVVDTYDLSELKLVGGVSVDAENSIQPKVLWQQADYSAPFTVVAQLDEESSNSLDKNNFTAKVVGKNNTTAVAGVTATVDGTATSFETEDEVTTWTIKGNIISSASAAEINNKRLEIDLDGNGTAWEPIYLALTGKTITKPFSSVSLSDVSGAKAKAGQKKVTVTVTPVTNVTEEMAPKAKIEWTLTGDTNGMAALVSGKESVSNSTETGDHKFTATLVTTAKYKDNAYTSSIYLDPKEAGTVNLEAIATAYDENSTLIEQSWAQERNTKNIAIEATSETALTDFAISVENPRDDSGDVLYIGDDEFTELTLEATVGSNIGDQKVYASLGLLEDNEDKISDYVKVYPSEEENAQEITNFTKIELNDSSVSGKRSRKLYVKSATQGEDKTVNFQATASLYDSTGNTSVDESGIVKNSRELTIRNNPIEEMDVTLGSSDLLVDGELVPVKARIALDGAYGYAEDPDATGVIVDSLDLVWTSEKTDNNVDAVVFDHTNDTIVWDAKNSIIVATTYIGGGTEASSGKKINVKATAKNNGKTLGYEVDKDSTTITVKGSFLSKVDSVTLSPSTIYVGGANTTARVSISGQTESVIKGANNRRVLVTWTLGNGTSAAFADPDSMLGTGKNKTLATYNSTTEKWESEVLISGTNVGNELVSVSAAVYPANNNDTALEDAENTAVTSSEGNEESATKPKLSVASAMATEFTNEADLTSGMVKGGKKTLKTKITVNGVEDDFKTYASTLASDGVKWNYIKVTYTSNTNNVLKLGKSDGTYTYTKYIPKSDLSAKTGTANVVDELAVYGGTANVNSTSTITVEACLVKANEAQVGNTTGTGAETEIANTTTNSKVTGILLSQALSDGEIFITSNGESFEVGSDKAAANAKLYVGNTAEIEASVKCAAEDVSKVEFEYKYSQDYSDNSIFGTSKIDATGKTVVATGSAASGYSAKLVLPIEKAYATGNVLTITAKSYDADGTELETLPITSQTIQSYPAVDAPELGAISGAVVGDPIEITATIEPKVGDGVIDHVKVTWTGASNQYSFADATTEVSELTNGKYEAKTNIVFLTSGNVSLAAGAVQVDAYTGEKESTKLDGTAQNAAKAYSGILANDIASVSLIPTYDSVAGSDIMSNPYTIWADDSKQVALAGTVVRQDANVSNVSVSYAWEQDASDEGKGRIEFSKTGGENATDWATSINLTTTAPTSGNTFTVEGPVYVRATGGAAEGRIKVVATPTGGSANKVFTRESGKITVLQNAIDPIATSTTVDIDPTNIPYDGVANITWTLKSPYKSYEELHTALSNVGNIRVVFEDANAGTQGYTTPFLFRNNNTGEYNLASGYVDIDNPSTAFNEKVGGFEVSTTVKMKSETALDSIGFDSTKTAQILATATAYQSAASTKQGFAVSGKTTDGISVKEGELQGLSLSTATNMVMGGKTDGSQIITATLISKDTNLPSNTKLAWEWVSTDGSRISVTGRTATNGRYVDSLSGTTKEKQITINAATAGTGYLQATAYVDGSSTEQIVAKTNTITIKDYLEKVALNSDSETVKTLSTTEEFTLTADVTPSDITSIQGTGTIPPYQAVVVTWEYNGTAGAIEPKDGNWTSSKVIEPGNGTPASPLQITKTFVVKEADATGGTFTMTAQAYSDQESFVDANKLGDEVKATSKTSYVAAKNALEGVTLAVDTEDSELESDTDYTLKTVVTKSESAANIKAIKLTFSPTSAAQNPGTGSLTLNPTKETGITLTGTQLAQLWAAEGVNKGQKIRVGSHLGWSGDIEVTATAYSDEGATQKIGKEVKGKLAVSVKHSPNLSMSRTRNGASMKADDVINVLAGDSVTVRQNSDTSSAVAYIQGTQGAITSTTLNYAKSDAGDTAIESISKSASSTVGTIKTSSDVAVKTVSTIDIRTTATADYYGDATSLKLAIWPRLEQNDLSITPDNQTLATGEKQTFTLSAGTKDILTEESYSGGSKTTTDNITWLVSKGTTYSSSNADRADNVVTYEAGEDMSSIVIKANNTEAYYGNLTLRAVVNNQKPGASTVYKEVVFAVKAVLTGLDTNYINGREIKVGETDSWANYLTPQPSGIKGLTYSAASGNERIATVSINSSTGAAIVTGVSAGTTTIFVKAEKDGAEAEAAIKVVVVENTIALTTSASSYNTHNGASINLDEKIKNAAQTVVSKNGTAQTKSGVTFSYALADEESANYVTLSGTNNSTLQAKAAGTAKIDVTADLGSYGSKTVTVDVVVEDVIADSMVSINPAEYSIKTGETNASEAIVASTTLSDSNIAWKWTAPEAEASHITFSNSASASTTVRIDSSYTTAKDIVLTATATQTLKDGELSTTKPTGKATMTLHVVTSDVTTSALNINETVDEKVEKKNNTTIKMATGARRTFTATAVTAGAKLKQDGYTWKAYTSQSATSDASKIVSITNAALDTATIRAVSAGTAYIQVVGTNDVTPATATAGDWFTVEIVEAPAYSPAISVIDSDGQDVANYTGTPAAANSILVNESYNVGWTLNAVKGSVPEGYSLEVNVTNNETTKDENQQVIVPIDTTQMLEDGTGTIKGAYPSANGMTFQYSLVHTNDNGIIDSRVDGTPRTVKVVDVTLSGIELPSGAAKTIEPGEDLVITPVNTPSNATNVTYQWKLKDSTNNNVIGNTTYMKVLGYTSGTSMTANTITIRGVAEMSDAVYTLTCTPYQGTTAKTALAKTTNITVKYSDVDVTGIDVYVDGKKQTSEADVFALNNAQGSSMTLTGMVLPTNATVKSLNWYSTDESKIVKKSQSESGTSAEFEAVGGQTGTVVLYAMAAGTRKVVTKNVIINLKEAGLESADIVISGHEGESAASDTIRTGATTTLKALPFPRSVTVDETKTEWEIVKADGADKISGAISLVKNNDGSATVTGLFGGTNIAPEKDAVVAALYDEKGNKVESQKFEIKVVNGAIAFIAAELDQTGTISIKKGEEISVSMTSYLPTGADVSKLSWTSDTPASVTVTPDEADNTKAVIKGVGNGTATISLNDPTGTSNPLSSFIVNVLVDQAHGVSIDSVKVGDTEVLQSDNGQPKDGNTDDGLFAVVGAGATLEIAGRAMYNTATVASDPTIMWEADGVQISASAAEKVTYVAPQTTRVVTITATASDSSAGTFTKKLTVYVAPKLSGKLLEVDDLAQAEIPYDGKEHKQAVAMKYRGIELVEDTDYTVSYTGDLVNAGTVTANVAAAGRFANDAANPISKTYQITPTAITAETLTITFDKLTYNGKAQTPIVKTAKFGDVDVKDAIVLSGVTNNVNAGAGKVTVGIDGQKNTNLTGSFETTFAIDKADASALKPTLTGTSFTYNAKVQKPLKVVLKGADGKEIAAEEYTVYYAGKTTAASKNAGIYKVTITMKGTATNYKGTTDATKYTINKAANTVKVKSTNLTVYGTGTGTIQFTSTKRGTISYKSADARIAKVAKKGNNGVVTGVAPGKSVKITVTDNGGTNYKSSSATVTVKVVRPGNASKLAVNNKTKKKFKVSWKKGANATGHYVEVLLNNKVVNKTPVKGTSATISGLTSGKKYTVRVWSYAGSKYSTASRSAKAVVKKNVTCK